MISTKLIVYGRVQGVGFRFYIKTQANKYNINGYIKNLIDGSVEIVAQGQESDLNSFKASIIRGNGFSRVENIEEERFSEKNFSLFSVKY
ncbi:MULTISPECIES: acylphosphatase [Oceanotoga]|jgi:acylphosphatase|uniref:acylphosphatase n=1 Tax=Oceanotoga teriensis TaxID=515440 RepID=A0AA45C960_9BACT|nr:MULTISPECIES: acylphosphatase [Oceanotoga]MDN5341629.1 acylphosphatase [Oceanotoga sp.]MDO7977168.1 acylphosphatase [Oceanotoga teriensis]PWJ96561.1 acylphosphatase [Oceanotoga teriensis]